MGRDEVLSTLRRHEAALRKAGVERLFVFGSVARGDASPDSDIDLMAAFDDALSLVDIVRIERMLEDLLGARIELVQEGTLKPRVHAQAKRELVRAF
jgi:predicted nucleotidyltransferase